MGNGEVGCSGGKGPPFPSSAPVLATILALPGLFAGTQNEVVCPCGKDLLSPWSMSW